MKLVRINEKKHEERGAETHAMVVEHFDSHKKDVQQAHVAAVKAVRDAHADAAKAHKIDCERIDATHEEQLALHVEYEKRRKEVDERIAEVKKKLPKPLPFPPPQWVCELLNWPREPLPERPKPEHPGYPPEPVKLEPPAPPEMVEPEPIHPVAPTYTATQVADTEDNASGIEVETPWGVARAMPGTWVLTNDETGEAHIETQEAIDAAYDRT